MKSVKSVGFKILLGLFVTSGPLLLVSCGGGAFTSTAPGVNEQKSLAASEAAEAIHTTDASIGYVFSRSFIEYNPPCPGGGCGKIFNPVYSYSIDPASGMPSLIGVESDSPPENTKFIKVAPSDRHLYILTGDNQIHTFSIGFSIFTLDEFAKQNLNPLNLYNALSKAVNITGTVLSAEDIVNQLNSLLEQPELYYLISASNPNLIETAEVNKLKADTITSISTPFADLTESLQKSVIRLNRLMIELAYPQETPTNKGARVQHAVGAPVPPPPAPPPAPPSMLPLSWVDTQSIELDVMGKFAYALGSKIVDYSFDTVTGKWIPIIKPAVAVYARDPATGLLSFIDIQLLDIGRLIFAQSGLIAYGSTNGSLQTYSVNRNNGLLDGVGAPFTFRYWLVGDSYHNMALDPSGKFLHLIANSGIQQGHDPNRGCVDTASLGSLIYTFIIDQNTDLLTQAGPPVDTTPHVITSVSVDTKGRFVQLLNTHEYVGGSYTPDACDAGSDSLLNPGAIYSYYVEQASGKLIPSGSVQAGGTQLPTGFVAAGYDSISLTGDVSGRFLYLLNPGSIYVYNVDQANGALTAIGSPLTGATPTLMPWASEPVVWPSVCYTNSVLNGYCSKSVGSRSHSLTWAGY